MIDRMFQFLFDTGVGKIVLFFVALGMILAVSFIPDGLIGALAAAAIVVVALAFVAIATGSDRT